MARVFSWLAVLLVLVSPGTPRADDEKRLEDIARVVERGDHARALGLLRGYVKDHPNDDLAWTMLGNTCEELDRDAEADEAYVSAIRLDPKRVEAITGRGILARKKGDLDGAVGFYREALRIDPRYAQALSSLVAIFILREDYPQAVEHAERAYRLEPTDPVVAGNLAWAYHYSGDARKRDEMTRIAEKLGYPNVDALQEAAAE